MMYISKLTSDNFSHSKPSTNGLFYRDVKYRMVKVNMSFLAKIIQQKIPKILTRLPSKVRYNILSKLGQ